MRNLNRNYYNINYLCVGFNTKKAEKNIKQKDRMG